jgi:hypothetical protein
MDERQDYLRRLIAQLDVVLPEHRLVLGDLLTARARGILTSVSERGVADLHPDDGYRRRLCPAWQQIPIIELRT